MNINKDIIYKITKDKDECIDCKRCFTNCPMMKEFGKSPKDIMTNLIENKINVSDIAYSCMLCDLCSNKCPKGINLKTTFYNLRKDIFKNKLKEVKYSAVKIHQLSSFSKVFSKSSRSKDSKVLFLPGCSLSSYSKDVVLKAYEYLKLHYGEINLTFNCCGKPTLAMGDTDRFKVYYSKLEQIIDKNGVEEIIVACPNCYNTIGKYSENIKITSIYEVINKFGIPKNLEKNYKNIDIAIHDSCSVRNEAIIQDSVRDILKKLGLNIIEFKNNRENTVCCGSGGMVLVTNRNLAVDQIKKRVSETNCENIVCYCEACCESLLNNNKNILHILDLLFNEKVINKEVFTQSPQGSINKWKMRYKSTGIINK
ncbi:MAG: (Fe-S)-binding protein [Paraclostridium sp.]